MKGIKVVIVDDHPLFRQGVADALSLDPDIEIVAQASNGEKGLDSVRKLKPDIAIIDINLPDMNGHQITGLIISENIPTRVILLTAYDDAEQKIHAMRAGAVAYCNKDIQAGHLTDVIRVVSEGKYVIGDQLFEPEGLAEWLQGNSQSSGRASNHPGEPYEPLTAREMEVLLEITHGRSNKEIALQLGISHQTVKNHVTSIFRKLDVEDRTQAAIYALRQGWVRLYQSISHNQE